MNKVRWVNQSHPQTLQIGVILLYFDAFFLVIGGGLASGLGFLLAASFAGAAFAIANNKRMGWYLGLTISAIVPVFVLFAIAADGLGTLFDIDWLIRLVIPIAHFAALIHPMSQRHVKIWFD